MFALIIATAIAAQQPVVHQDQVAHQGATYSLSYRPHVETSMRTIGQSVGSRPSTERCLWRANITLNREISRADSSERLVKRVHGDGHQVEGQAPGKCGRDRGHIKDMIAAKVAGAQDHVVAMAQADRPAALADIDAAHALALN